MKIYCNIGKTLVAHKSVVTVGSFDGIHRGHQAILEKTRELAKMEGEFSTVVTFDPHPQKVVGKRINDVKILTTNREKIQACKDAGIDRVGIIPFTKAFASLSAVEFVKDILIKKLAVHQMVVGYDHHFGRNREGGFERLQKLGESFGFQVYQVQPFIKNKEIVSSSVIRELLRGGSVEKAAEFIGRPYSLHGKVIEGARRGREIGFPTANIEVDHEDKLIPRRGVYAINILIGQQIYKGMMNIGRRPTFINDNLLTLEAHIFDFSADLYGQELEIYFKKYIREEKQFSGIEELKSQLYHDKIVCENM